MLQYEKKAWEKGYQRIAGTDEAGRGPLAGPVVIAAVILNPADIISGLNDSKQLSATKRETLAEEIKARALAYRIVMIGEAEIDSVNIYKASKHGMEQALHELPLSPDYALTDAMPITIDLPYEAIIKGDQLSASIAAASILAKVERDRYMIELDQMYPQYGFAQHKGYPTKKHLAAIKKHGPCPAHRKTYAPIKHWTQEQLKLAFEGDF